MCIMYRSKFNIATAGKIFCQNGVTVSGQNTKRSPPPFIEFAQVHFTYFHSPSNIKYAQLILPYLLEMRANVLPLLISTVLSLLCVTRALFSAACPSPPCINETEFLPPRSELGQSMPIVTSPPFRWKVRPNEVP